MLGEAFIGGVVSSAVGLGVGVLFAVGLKSLLKAFGIDLPSTSMQFLAPHGDRLVYRGCRRDGAAVVTRQAGIEVAPIAALRPADEPAGRCAGHRGGQW